MSKTATPEKNSTGELTVKQKKNFYVFVYEGISYDVFEYITYDGDPEPITTRLFVYYTDEAESVSVDKELENLITEAIKNLPIR